MHFTHVSAGDLTHDWLQPGLKSSKAWPYHGSVTGFSPKRPVFKHKLVRVRYVVNKAALEKGFV